MSKASLPPKLFKCPRCGELNRVPESRTGRDIRCGGCQLLIQKRRADSDGEAGAEDALAEGDEGRRIREWIDIHQMTSPDDLVLPDDLLGEESLGMNGKAGHSTVGAGDKVGRQGRDEGLAGVVALPTGWWKKRREEQLEREAAEAAKDDEGMHRWLPPKWLFIGLIGFATLALVGLGGWALRSMATSSGRWAEAAPGQVVDKMQLERMVDRFMAARTVEEILPMVRDPERVRSSVERFIANDGMENAEAVPNIIENPGGFILAQYLFKYETGRLRMITIVAEESGPKIDWESFYREGTAGYEDLLRGVPEGAEVRVVLSRGSYYNFDFKDESIWAAYEVNHADWESPFTGYVKRGSPEDELINSLLNSPSGGGAAILRISTTPEQGPRRQCLIEKVLEKGWIKGAGQSKEM